ncbi:MAG: phosphoribosylformylglycinamidine cyclo-ligase [Pseudomonadota bacterium]
MAEKSGVSSAVSYADAGVDIDAGNALVKTIAPLAAKTRRAGTDAALGGFGGMFDLTALSYKEPLLVASTDGVGTKLTLAQAINDHHTMGIDLVAACVNDIVMQGAEPLFFLDYFACGKLDGDIASAVIAGIARACQQTNTALIGGESAEMPGFYAPSRYDLAGFAVGVVEKPQVITGEKIRAGDALIALASNGIHANGFSLVRHVIDQQKLTFDTPAPFDGSMKLGAALCQPTALYVDDILRVCHSARVHGLCHITGGGVIDNIGRTLPKGLQAQLHRWPWPAVFGWLHDCGVGADEMIRTFNCGIGAIIIAPQEQADHILGTIKNHACWQVGEIVSTQDEKRVTVV